MKNLSFVYERRDVKLKGFIYRDKKIFHLGLLTHREDRLEFSLERERRRRSEEDERASELWQTVSAEWKSTMNLGELETVNKADSYFETAGFQAYARSNIIS